MSKSLLSSYPKGFGKGVAIRGMPVLNTYGGDVYWVDSNGGGGGKGTFNHPCKTFNTAYDLCTTDNGDMVVLKPGHSETITATVALDTSAVHVLGLGHGSKRPKLLWDAAAAADNMFEVTAAGQIMENIWFYDSNTTACSIAQVFIDVQSGGDDFTMINCRLEQRAATEEAVTVCYGADDLSFISCEFIGTSAPTSSGADSGIIFEGACNRVKIIDCLFDYTGSTGCDVGNIVFESGTFPSVLIKDCITIGNANGEEFVQVSSQTAVLNDGLIMHCGGKVTDLTDVIIVSDNFSVIDSYFAEGDGKFAGACMPAGTDDLNRWVPAATAAS